MELEGNYAKLQRLHPEALAQLELQQGKMRTCCSLDQMASVVGWSVIEKFLEFYELQEFQHIPLELEREVVAGEALLLRRRLDQGTTYDGILLTVGQTVGSLIITLEACQPKRVCLFPTQETRGNADEIRDRLSYGPTVDIEEIDATDTGLLYKKIIEKIRAYEKLGFRRFAIDGTGGKKSMSQGAALAAEYTGIDLLYVDAESMVTPLRPFVGGGDTGPRPRFGRRNPATQRLVVLPRPEDEFGDRRIDQIVETINSGHFRAAMGMCEDLLGRVRGLSHSKVKALQSVAKAFEWCQLGGFKEAEDAFSNLDEDFRRGDLRWPDETTYLKLENIRGICKEIGDIGTDIQRLSGEDGGRRQNEALGENRLQSAAGLFESLDFARRLRSVICLLTEDAKREAGNGRFDMASLLVYRSLELAVHTLLSERSVIPFGDLRMSDAMRLQTAEPFSALKARLMKNVGREYPLPEKLALFDGLVLLSVLSGKDRDDNGQIRGKTIRELEQLRGLTESRNKSRLAHGLKVIDERNFQDFSDCVRDFLEKHGLYPQSSDYQFPSLSVPEARR